MKYTDRAAGDVAVIYWLTVSESYCDTWQLLGKWHGATWPSHGLPRGTPFLVCVLVQKFCGADQI
jgi:hypothetical protein